MDTFNNFPQRPPELYPPTTIPKPSRRPLDLMMVLGLSQHLLKGIIGFILLLTVLIAAALMLYTSWKLFWRLIQFIDNYIGVQ